MFQAHSISLDLPLDFSSLSLSNLCLTLWVLAVMVSLSPTTMLRSLSESLSTCSFWYGLFLFIRRSDTSLFFLLYSSITWKRQGNWDTREVEGGDCVNQAFVFELLQRNHC